MFFYENVVVRIVNYYTLCYNKSMKREYKTNKTTTSLIKYHFVFCSKYRRKIFLIPGVEQRMKELTKEQCEKEQIEILEMKCDVDHVYLYVRVYPQTTISRIMGSIRDCTSKILRKEFVELSRMSALWTRPYLVSTEPYISEETIQWFVEQQKKRG